MFILLEKEHRYILFVLDRYTRKLQIIDPQEISLKEFKKEQEGVKLDDLDIYEANKAIEDMEAKKMKKENDHEKYHKHKFKVVSIVNNNFSVFTNCTR